MTTVPSFSRLVAAEGGAIELMVVCMNIYNEFNNCFGICLFG